MEFLQRSQSYTCLKPEGHQTLLYFYFRLGKGQSSQDFLFVCGIINYNFGLSAFIFSTSGVKINNIPPPPPSLGNNTVKRFIWSTHEQGYRKTNCQLLHLADLLLIPVGELITIHHPDFCRTVCRHNTLIFIGRLTACYRYCIWRIYYWYQLAN